MTEMEPIDVMYDEAIVKGKSGDTDAAIEMLRQLLTKNPKYVLAHHALAVYYSRREKFDQAIEHAKLACEYDPEDTFGYTILSTLCIKAGRREEAEDALMQSREKMIAARIKAVEEHRKNNPEEEQ